jgi:hypothetical protein
VEPSLSHEDGPKCVYALTNDFIRRGTADGLDVSSCRDQIKPIPFLTELPKEGIKPFG